MRGCVQNQRLVNLFDKNLRLSINRLQAALFVGLWEQERPAVQPHFALPFPRSACQSTRHLSDLWHLQLLFQQFLFGLIISSVILVFLELISLPTVVCIVLDYRGAERVQTLVFGAGRPHVRTDREPCMLLDDLGEDRLEHFE